MIGFLKQQVSLYIAQAWRLSELPPSSMVPPTCILNTEKNSSLSRLIQPSNHNASIPSSDQSFYKNNNLTLLSHKITFPRIFAKICKIICIISSRDLFWKDFRSKSLTTSIYLLQRHQQLLIIFLMLPYATCFTRELPFLVNDFSPSGEHMLGFRRSYKSEKFVNRLYHMFVISMV